MRSPLNSTRSAEDPIRRLGQAGWIAILVLAVGLITLSLPGRLLAEAPTQAAAKTADVVVDYGDGAVDVRRVPVGESGISGLEALSRTALAMDITGGGAVCAINGRGCPATDCFCACQTAASCRFWSYNHQKPDGSWDSAMTGPIQYTVTHGAVEGWVWGGSRPPIAAPDWLRGALLGETWLAGHRLANGSHADHAGLTAEAVIAARATGRDVTPAIPFLVAQAEAYSKQGAAQAGKLAVAVAAAQFDPRNVAGLDLAKRISGTYQASTGQFGASVWDQSWAMLGLAASGEPVPDQALERLMKSEATGGGWSLTAGGPEADADSTGLALQAAGVGLTNRADLISLTFETQRRATAWLHDHQNADGGWGHDGPSNVNSTAYVLQGAITTVGELWQEPWFKRSPRPYLLGEQRSDGHFQYDQAPSDLVATLQTVPALSGWSFGLFRSRTVAARKAAARILAWQQADGGFGDEVGLTVEAVLALAANGQSAALNRAGGGRQSAASYLQSHAAAFAKEGAASAGSLTVAALALNRNPRRFGGANLVQTLLKTYEPATGIFTGTYTDTIGSGFESPAKRQSWGLLGLAAAGEPIPPPAVTALVSMALSTGGWVINDAFDRADPETTGLALQALLAAGLPKDDPTVLQAIDVLDAHRQQWHWSGSATDFPNEPRNTGYAVGGLLAAGQRIDGPAWRLAGANQLRGDGPWDDLIRMQSPLGGFNGGGAFAPEGDAPSDTFAAALALAGRPLPFVGRRPLYVPRTPKGVR